MQQNLELREAHENSLTEMEELKKFQSSTFDTIAMRKLVEDRDIIRELTGKIQESQNAIICMIHSRDFQDAESARSGHPTLPVNQRYSHLLAILANAEPFSGNAEPQR